MTAQLRTIPRAATALAALVALLALAAGLLTAGGGAARADDDRPGAGASTTTPRSTPPGKAWVRAGHFVPGLGAASVELAPTDGGRASTTADGVTYGAVSDYGSLAPGSYTATVRQSEDSGDSAPMLSRTFDVPAGEARTLAVVGTSDAPRLALLTDDLTPPARGAARVRLLAAASAADTVTVTAVGGPVLAQDTTIGQATGYASVPAGPWRLELDSPDVDTSGSVRLVSGSVYTVVVLDDDRGGVRLEVVTDAAGATVMPRGGAETGRGGAVDDRITPPGGLTGPVALLIGVGLTAAVTGLRRRRDTTRRGR